jgi:uncharacterized protein
MKAGYLQQERAQDATILQKSFLWMFAGLLITGFTAVGTAAYPPLGQLVLGNPIIFYGLIIAELGFVFAISAGITRMAPVTAMSLFVVYAVLNGLTLSVIFFVYNIGSISAAFFSSALVFGAMAAYGYTTKKDLSSIGSIALMALIGIIVASVINMFLHVTGLSLLISYAAVLIFTALTAYDTQKIKEMSSTMPGASNLGIYGALRLYLDFINIFLALLRIMGGNRR